MNTLNVSSLSFAEQFVIWAIRISLSPTPTTEQVDRTLTDAFRLLRIPGALHSFLDFVGVAAIAWHDTQRVPDVRCTCSASVGEDEWRLLQTLAALQRRELELASSWMRDELPPPHMRILMDRGLMFASMLQQRGCVLPVAGTTLSDPPLPRVTTSASLH